MVLIEKNILIEVAQIKPDHVKVLKEYYSRYLREVRGNSKTTVNHYLDALNNISRRLKEKKLVEENIYEIADIDRLLQVKEILFLDPGFKADDNRGRRMYSAGLNNYCRFAQGEGFDTILESSAKIDIPVAPESALTVSEVVWKRSGILRAQAFEIAGYQCELGKEHQTFTAESTNKPYMEGHHAIPMNKQDSFNVSLDVYANIICLCPLCHRKIHYGVYTERKRMVEKIYHNRMDRLANSGIKLSEEEFYCATM